MKHKQLHGERKSWYSKSRKKRKFKNEEKERKKRRYDWNKNKEKSKNGSYKRNMTRSKGWQGRTSRSKRRSSRSLSNQRT